jgi:type I restriction enzyme S subunit
MSVTVRVVERASIERWDVKHLLGRHWLRPGEDMLPLSAVVTPRREPNRDGYRFGSVHFDGSISVRDEATEIAGATWIARAGDIVFSKIDARNGAIAVMPEDSEPLAFTAEFPIYSLKRDGRLTLGFAQLLLRTDVFLSRLEALAVGHSGRKRVPPEVFEKIEIPVPSQDRQQQIAEAHRELMASAEAIRARAEPIVSVAAAGVLEALDMSFVRLPQPPLTFAVPLHTLPRWSVRKGAEVLRGVTGEIEAGYPVVRLGDDELITVQRGISKSPDNRPADNAVPYVRVANVQPGFVDLADVQELDVPAELRPASELRAGDVLVCRNNSLEWVGKAAPWAAEIEPCVHDDHVFAVRCDPTRLRPAFLNAYLQTDFARSWFISEAQITTNLAGIAGGAITELPIPLPSVEIQDEISAHFDGQRAEAVRCFAEGERLASSAHAVAEYAIATGELPHF